MEKFDKDKKPKFLTDNCDGCQTDYKITPDNGKIVHHAEQPECDYIICSCPNCNYRTMIFINDTTFEHGVRTGLDLEVNKYADENTYKWWTEVKGIQLVKTYELTDRHEAIIRKFGENILAIPDDVFWDNIEAESSRPYPEMWT